MSQRSTDFGCPGSSNNRAKYDEAETQCLINFVINEGGGTLTLPLARQIGRRLNRKSASIIGKARSLGLDYRPEGEPSPALVKQVPCISEVPMSEAEREPVDSTSDTGSACEYTLPALGAVDCLSAWTAQLDQLGEQFAERGLDKLWAIQRFTLKRTLQRAATLIDSESLFQGSELDAQRRVKIAELERTFVAVQSAGLRRWPFLFGRVKFYDEPTLEKKYAARGMTPGYRLAREKCNGERKEIAYLGADQLISRDEIAARRFQRLAANRESLISAQLEKLGRYAIYLNQLAGLKRENLDDQLAVLEREFAYIGRSRLWCDAFEKMAFEVVEVTSGGVIADADRNESALRLLQNDFLLTMQQRLATYWRLFKIRKRAFETENGELIRRLGYFEDSLLDMYDQGMDPEQIDQRVTAVINVLVKRTAKASTRDQVREQERREHSLLEIDHEQRRVVWTEFNQSDAPGTVSTRLKELKQLVQYTPEWLHEYQIFRSELLLRRAMDGSRQDSRDERRDAQQFIDDLSNRINEGLDAEITFRQLEQQLIRDDQFQTELNEARKKIETYIKQRGRAANLKIVDIKREFVSAINVLRNPRVETRGRVLHLKSWRR